MKVVIDIVLLYTVALVSGAISGKLVDKYSKKYNGYAVSYLVAFTIFIAGIIKISLS